ncbi:NgoFVII family restriction endonuclease [Paenibacillus selenitireducens]|uniref:NgoFVII family restriction endonuclease n=1 Tax=Paenibacillus selenitireducens TaxID=1324314 RepID=A0A1T2X0L0_9BACL|nr:DEAD/DEAH box helicase [Paenibacillus selenitireducens]OPA73459.1 NgoFVII family restriction endonuclease [Paenibacillus selenitireducens]
MTNGTLNFDPPTYNGNLSSLDENLIYYSPQLLINNPSKNENILSSVLEQLSQCQSFMFIVAFVTESGLATLKSHFYDLKRKGIRGRLLTSTYLYFNHPKVFRELLKIENMDVRLTDLKGFHSKGYIFNNDEHHALIIGSSNLTAQALKLNYEWNVKLMLNPNDKLLIQIRNQFEEVWNSANSLTNEWITNYEKTFVQYTAKKIIEEEVAALTSEPTEQLIISAIKPNKMQQYALQNLESVRLAEQQKALVISATGTGKTYLSAFDVKNHNPSRMLFIAHREQILLKAKSDYFNVIGGHKSDYGLLSSTGKTTSAKYLFSTIQMMSKNDVLTQFDPEAFDYILIDEVHKAGANSYRKVIDYFKPKFLLGMTATPERTDEFNIYQLFDYNVAYEIRLQAALEEDMLCPFHYFGVTDLVLDGEVIDNATVLAKLLTDERVDHLIDKIEYYGFSGSKVKGLIFCSRKEEAQQLSSALNGRGYRTVALTGDDAVDKREVQIQALEKGELEYIITVDIFNEGIDIPSVNQVVMLRQTQSSIVFIQQLGRGLRKHDDKEFVTIIDFIGNYKNNYLIPIALSGDQSLNKDNIRRKMKDNSYINGLSTINFEEIAKEQIYKSINDSNLTELKKLREAYFELKNRIGRSPQLSDFIVHNSIDPVVITKTFPSYYEFLIRIKEDVPTLSLYEQKVLVMLSAELLAGKREHEVILLDMLVHQGSTSYEEYRCTLEQMNYMSDEKTITSVIRVMDLSFFVHAQRAKYGDQPICILKDNQMILLNSDLSTSMNANAYFKELVLDLLVSAREKAKDYVKNSPLTLYQKYTRKDACKLLNWESDESSTMYGYKSKHDTCPIFVTYHKHDEVESSIAYGDEFVSPSIFKWFTRSNRTLQSEEVQKIIMAEENNIDIHIFVKKDDDEGSDFYYLGCATPNKSSVQQTFMTGKNDKEVPVVHMDMIMEHAVEHKLYNYIKAQTQN